LEDYSSFISLNSTTGFLTVLDYETIRDVTAIYIQTNNTQPGGIGYLSSFAVNVISIQIFWVFIPNLEPYFQIEIKDQTFVVESTSDVFFIRYP
jgi:hypothetical protein